MKGIASSLRELVTPLRESITYAQIIDEQTFLDKHLANLRRKRTNNAKVLTLKGHKTEQFLNRIYANSNS
jgi:hypothetical protein